MAEPVELSHGHLEATPDVRTANERACNYLARNFPETHFALITFESGQAHVSSTIEDRDELVQALLEAAEHLGEVSDG